ncbi:MAG: hypothetical protein LC676_03830 [Loktanella sp.]|nr:hypothetical protein [Loktanella sp.]
MRVFVPFLLAVTLTACGSSSGLSQATDNAAAADALKDRLDETPVSPPAQLPTLGTAEYSGFMFIDLPVTPDNPSLQTAYVGQMRMVVAFDERAEPLSGTAAGFTDRLNVALGGQLDLGGGTVFRGNDPDSNYTLEGAVAGRLNHPDVGAMVVDGSIAGEFRGLNQEGVQGVVFGDVTSSLGEELFDGSFAAERQIEEDAP